MMLCKTVPQKEANNGNNDEPETRPQSGRRRKVGSPVVDQLPTTDFKLYLHGSIY